MPLADSRLRGLMELGWLVIKPAPEDFRIQPASIDLTLGNEFAVRSNLPHRNDLIDLCNIESSPQMTKMNSEFYDLPPLSFCLAHTSEWIEIDSQLCARIEGKSSIGRHGLAVHVTAGFIDPGFKGHLTLELFNATQYAMRLTAGMAICQLAVDNIEGHVERPYGHDGLKSRYQCQSGATPAR